MFHLIFQILMITIFFSIVIYCYLRISSTKIVINIKKESFENDEVIERDESTEEEVIPCGDITVSSPISNLNENSQNNNIVFSSPLLINNTSNNLVNFNNDVRFDENTLFDSNNNVSINGSMYLNSESSIFFDYSNNINNKLTKRDIIPIKMAKAKANFLINSTGDVSQFVDGEKLSSYSSQTGGSSKCTSTIWSIITGSKVPGSELCKNCCKKPKGKGLVKVVIVHANSSITEIVLDMEKSSSLHMFKNCESTVTNGSNILLFRTSGDISCRLVLLNEDLSSKDLQTKKLRISQIKANPIRNYYEITSENQQWGTFQNSVISETEHIVRTNNYNSPSSFQYAHLEFIEN